MIKTKPITRGLFALLALVTTSVFLPTYACGQSRVETYLRKADLDSDGRIEPHEMTGPIKRYMLGKGYDITERHKIRDVVRASERKTETPKTASELKVPKFGVEATEGAGVSSFAGKVATVKYSESVNKRHVSFSRSTIEMEMAF